MAEVAVPLKVRVDGRQASLMPVSCFDQTTTSQIPLSVSRPWRKLYSARYTMVAVPLKARVDGR